MLILGEPGTGKTALANWIHAQSGRAGAFVRLPLTNVPEELRHAELQGHARGSFTGADRDRAGALELADGGTLLLDEIGLASEGMQTALLAVLDDPVVRRVGDPRPRAVDVRFIAATNEDLSTRAGLGRFRRDLLGRFGYFWLEVPPLRERPEDVLPLFRQFVASDFGIEPRDVRLRPELEEALGAFAWPDNVRQVLHVARYAAVAAARATAIGLEHLPPVFVRHALGGDGGTAAIDAAIRWAGGNRTKAAELLQIGRTTLYRRMGKGRDGGEEGGEGT